MSTTFEPHRARLLTTDQAAQHLSISRRCLQMKVQGREVSFVKIGKSLRFDVRDLDEFIDRNRRRAIGWKAGGAK